MLAERFVNLSWRLKRAERMQNQAIDVMIERDGPSPLAQRIKASLPKFLQDVHDDPRGGAAELILGRAAIDDCANYRTLERLSMYERRIESSMLSTLKELESRQAMREIEQVRATAEQQSPPEPSLPTQKKGSLKKQSQFAAAQTDANFCVLRAYENTPRREPWGNEPKQTQLPAFGRKSEAQAVD
jgi:hypothetical protein